MTEKMDRPAIDTVDGSNDFGGLIGPLGDGGPNPAAILACPHLLELEGSPRGLPRALGREAAVDRRLGDGVGAQDAGAFVDRFPGAHQEVAVGEAGGRHAEEAAGVGGGGGNEEELEKRGGEGGEEAASADWEEE